MMKLVSHCFVISMLFLAYSVSGQEVEVYIDHPDQVKAGEEFQVSVTIRKGSLTDYSRFSQDLPLGLTATNVSSPNADFSFDNQRIRIIWLKMSDSNDVTVTYKVKVNERLKGTFMLGGVFAYVVEEERKFVNVDQSKEIRIIPSPTLDPVFIVDIRDYKGDNASAAVASTGEEPFAMAIRQKPVLLESGGYLIHLLIKNPTESKYAKLEEKIPAGYIFEEVSSNDGIVSHATSTVKFIWMKLPPSPEFEVAYKLIPRQNEKQGPMVIEGMLTYTSGSENKLVKVKQLDVELDALTAPEKSNLLLTGVTTGGAVKTASGTSSTDEKLVQESVKKSRPPVTPEETRTPAGGIIENTRVLEPGSGVYFRVQLTANRTPIDAPLFFRDSGVDMEVKVEQHHGLYKYSVGPFQTYDQALAYRNRVERLPAVEGSFVVAFRDGERIPVSSVHH